MGEGNKPRTPRRVERVGRAMEWGEGATVASPTSKNRFLDAVERLNARPIFPRVLFRGNNKKISSPWRLMKSLIGYRVCPRDCILRSLTAVILPLRRIKDTTIIAGALVLFRVQSLHRLRRARAFPFGTMLARAESRDSSTFILSLKGDTQSSTHRPNDNVVWDFLGEIDRSMWKETKAARREPFVSNRRSTT